MTLTRRKFLKWLGIGSAAAAVPVGAVTTFRSGTPGMTATEVTQGLTASRMRGLEHAAHRAMAEMYRSSYYRVEAEQAEERRTTNDPTLPSGRDDIQL